MGGPAAICLTIGLAVAETAVLADTRRWGVQEVEGSDWAAKASVGPVKWSASAQADLVAVDGIADRLA